MQTMARASMDQVESQLLDRFDLIEQLAAILKADAVPELCNQVVADPEGTESLLIHKLLAYALIKLADAKDLQLNEPSLEDPTP
jgi:hypothetical protein